MIAQFPVFPCYCRGLLQTQFIEQIHTTGRYTVCRLWVRFDMTVETRVVLLSSVLVVVVVRSEDKIDFKYNSTLSSSMFH